MVVEFFPLPRCEKAMLEAEKQTASPGEWIKVNIKDLQGSACEVYKAKIEVLKNGDWQLLSTCSPGEPCYVSFSENEKGTNKIRAKLVYTGYPFISSEIITNEVEINVQGSTTKSKIFGYSCDDNKLLLSLNVPFGTYWEIYGNGKEIWFRVEKNSNFSYELNGKFEIYDIACNKIGEGKMNVEKNGIYNIKVYGPLTSTSLPPRIEKLGFCCWDANVYDATCLGNTAISGGGRSIMASLITPRTHFSKPAWEHLKKGDGNMGIKYILLLFLLVPLLAPLVSAESSLHLNIYLYINVNDTVKLLNLSILSGPEIPLFYPEGNFTFQIFSRNDQIVYQRNFSVDFVILSDPPIFTNETIIFLSVPLLPNMQTIKLFKGKKLIFEENIEKFLCNHNAKCENFENFYSCPDDCSSGSKDNICDALIDGKCDPDCPEGVDPDCNIPNETVIKPTGKNESLFIPREKNEKSRLTLILIGIFGLLLLAVVILILIKKRTKAAQISDSWIQPAFSQPWKR